MIMTKNLCEMCGSHSIAEIEDGWLECLSCRTVTYIDTSPHARSCGCGRSPDDIPLEDPWDDDSTESWTIHERPACRLRR